MIIRIRYGNVSLILKKRNKGQEFIFRYQIKFAKVTVTLKFQI